MWTGFKIRKKKNINELIDNIVIPKIIELNLAHKNDIRVYDNPVITTSKNLIMLFVKLIKLEEDTGIKKGKNFNILNNFLSTQAFQCKWTDLNIDDNDIQEFDNMKSVFDDEIETDGIIGHDVVVNCGLLNNVFGLVLNKLPDGRYVVQIKINNLDVNLTLNRSNITMLNN